MTISKTSNVLVCVTDQASSKRLIRAGASIAEKYGVPVNVISVLDEKNITDSTAAIMQELFDEANDVGAEMIFYFNGEPAITASVHAAKTNSLHIVSGTPGVGSNLFIETLKCLLPELPLTLLDSDDRMFTFPGIIVKDKLSSKSTT